MKIGIDISQIVYGGTGVATYTKLLVSALLKEAKEDRFVLFGSSLRNQKPMRDFFKSFGKENVKKKFYLFPPKLLEFLWNGVHVFPIENLIGEVDVFHSSDWLEPPTKNAKKVTTVHDLTVFKYSETFSPRGGHDIVRNQKRKLFFTKRDGDKIIAVSETTKKDLMEILKIPERKIKVIYEAADPSFSPREPEKIKEVRDKFKIKGEYLLCVGTREPRKNLERILSAFAEIVRANQDLSLVIVGKYGWGEDKFSKGNPSAKEGMTNIKILGFVEKDELAALYSGARAFVYPSLYEGFGLPVLEAMACGCPVITSNLGSMKEISGKAALLVEPESIDSLAGAISQALRSSKIYDELRLRGFKRAGEFNWERTASQTLEVYRSLI